jgi:hypothetical protein
MADPVSIEPVGVAVPSPAPAEAPANPSAGAAPSPESVVEAPEAPKHPSEIPTLLETLKAPGTEKPVEAPKPVEAKPEPEAPKAPEQPEPEAPPVEYKFEFPEHVKPEAAKVEAFTTLAREAKMTPEQAQKAMALFNEAATDFIAERKRQQTDDWNQLQREWENKSLSDPMIGGAGAKYAQGVIARMRDRFISDANPGTPGFAKDSAEFEDFLRTTGAGNHPVFLKMLYRVGARFDEPALISAVPKPTPTNGQRPSRSLYAPKA